MPELPRITRALRMFTSLGRSKKLLEFEPNDLVKKRNEQAVKLKSYDLNWQDLCRKLPSDALPHLNRLHRIASLVLEGHSTEVIDDFAIFTLRLLIEDCLVTRKKLEVIRGMAGNITADVINEIRQVVEKIRSHTNEEDLTLLGLSSLSSLSSLSIPVGGAVINGENENIFGAQLRYNNARAVWPDTGTLRDMSSAGVVPNVETFSMTYSDRATVPDKSEPFDKMAFLTSLKDYYRKNAATSVAMTYGEFKLAVMNRLKDAQSMQAELFDLLGCEHLELIEYMIEQRKAILNKYLPPRGPSLLLKQQLTEQSAERPVISGQVTVQSETEKQLLKQVRKEEKKLNKMISGKQRGGDTINIIVPKECEFDALELRLKRQEALTAMRMPLFARKPGTGGSSGSTVMGAVGGAGAGSMTQRFPFVFDSNVGRRCDTRFVSGQKIMLPADVRRVDSQLCEEVHIPAQISDTVIEGNDTRTPISTLDQVGQMAFAGVKALNRVQSIVFDAAYHTNENLLICAPTGAGKTNVAMLTVVHQLRQHMDRGELMKHQFKIVYIAPMKALAAEMTSNFGKRLSCLGVSVRELTGDMQLTKREIQETQMIVTTPEKWDVVTRKGTGDISLTSIVKLLIMDEVHLLHGDRGPVVEAIVARTLRQVESSQSMIRIVGLSATLPNYLDVARFLRVNPYKGLFYFDHRFRPVPLSQTFIGVKQVKPLLQMSDMDLVCYNNVVEMVRKGHQVMVFVHARNATVRMANVLRELAQKNDTSKVFTSEEGGKYASKAFAKSRNRHLAELFDSGFSVHHAGLLRSDRNLVEKYFADGLIKVLVCTSTLAWGVNLPAHGVVIRGTEIYDSKHGSFVDLGILDVLQIFGRAGRPQFDSTGHAVIITAHGKLSHYLSLLTNQIPIESSFITYLADNLNAEIALGTISNVEEAVEWLSYTYLFVRMKLNHLAYGIPYQTIVDDPNLEGKRRELIDTAARALDKARMVRYNERTGDLSTTDLGRIASHYYLKYDTVEIFNELLAAPIMTESQILGMISRSQEFEQLKVRDDELDELDTLAREYCELVPQGGPENIHGKVNILIQTYLSRGRVSTFSLISDQAYITQNAVRICRALFEIMLRKNNAIMASRLLEMAKMLELQQWSYSSPLRHFYYIPSEAIEKLEERNFAIDRLKSMPLKEIGSVLRNLKFAQAVRRGCDELPAMVMESSLQPITRTVLRIRLKVRAQFAWNDKVHGKSSEPFWIWIEDPENNFIYHHECFPLTKKHVCKGLEQEIVMTIPLSEPLPSQYLIKATSDRWLGCEETLPIQFQDLILPDSHPPHTDLLPLQPLPCAALGEPSFERLYKFTHFNPIQTQIFHCLYHTDNNVLLGAPTGSGKTIAAEIAMFRVFKHYPSEKVVYIAPLKALVRERINDWKVRLEERLGKRVVELTGDVSPDIKMIAGASVIVTTPEKWDGISRSWQTRSYVQRVALIVIDEIHLLGEDRGPVLEVIVSRTNFISSHTSRKLRVIGLSTALANAVDLANWLSINETGLYNFRPSVRPVPLEVHINGFPGKHYCPRMATMNRPTFQAIRQHAPSSPSLVFVSSRRQTRLTALDLIAYLAAEDNPKQWLHMPEEEMDNLLMDNIKDPNLKLTLAFGIGLHHAGLQEKDRRIVEELFVNNKIQVLITTATLAWGVNFPAHLVVIKGTEYYDGKTKRYVDMPITDVLQMMGRAGRPQFDDSGVAVVLVHDMKKSFYKKFLYEPFPVESSLLAVLPDHMNAEIVSGTVTTKQEFLDYLTWTYFFRRLLKNPRYYNLNALEPRSINEYLSGLVEDTVKVLTESNCIEYDETESTLHALPMGKIASFYYLSHQTMSMFYRSLVEDLTLDQYLRILTNSHEYDELPVRHNEELLNEELGSLCRYKVDQFTYDSPNTKAYLLLQAHFSRLPLPCTDYTTDLKSVLDQAIRIVQAMIDTVADQGWLPATLRIIQLLQMIIQARWVDESAILTLPHINKEHLYLLSSLPAPLPAFCAVTYNNYDRLSAALGTNEFYEGQIRQIHQVIREMPIIRISLTVQAQSESEIFKECIRLRGSVDDSSICLHRDQEYTLIVEMERENRSNNLRAHCPLYQKGKDEGWFLILGELFNMELWALKRATGINHSRKYHQLQFTTPKRLGSVTLTFYLMSDCYIGMDQQYDIHINVVQ